MNKSAKWVVTGNVEFAKFCTFVTQEYKLEKSLIEISVYNPKSQKSHNPQEGILKFLRIFCLFEHFQGILCLFYIIIFVTMMIFSM